MKNKIKIYL